MFAVLMDNLRQPVESFWIGGLGHQAWNGCHRHGDDEKQFLPVPDNCEMFHLLKVCSRFVTQR